MLKSFCVALILSATCAVAVAQEKGVDRQNENIRDAGRNRPPAVNGGKVDVGAGRGIDFGRGRTPEAVVLPNPFRLSARRDAIMEAARELMRERKLVLDEAASRPAEGILISQPYTFVRGAVVASSELNRLAEADATVGRGWTRGRYTLTVEVQPIDGTNTNVSVNANVEGRAEGVTGTQWVTLRSTGVAEQEFLSALVERVTGANPTEREPQPER